LRWLTWLLLISFVLSGGGMLPQLVERRATNRMIAKPWFDARCSRLRCILGKDTYCYFPSWVQSVYPLCWRPSL